MDRDRDARSISMICPTCGSTEFEYHAELEDGPIRCASCDRMFSREELIRENSVNLEAHVEDIKVDGLKDVERDLRKMLGKTFSGSKNIKFR